jgi:fructose-1,6-bisphosphatase
MHHGRTTLTRYTIEQEHKHPGASGEFSALLNSLATAFKIISNQVNKGALAAAPENGDTAGVSVEAIVQSEMRTRLTAISNDVMLQENESSGDLSGMASEEMDAVYAIPDHCRLGKYLLVFDPLDGSSNIDVNLTLGTIFSILRAPSPGSHAGLADFLQPGTAQVCAGLALYGPATMLVLTTGDGVDGFTLDRDIGAFVLTHPRMRIPADTHAFAINASNERFWEPPVKRYVGECLAGKTGPRDKDFNMRWIASVVADTFRILTRGGIFMYPKDSRDSLRPARLQLLYKANPISFLVEQAGGASTTGRERVMDIQPVELHQRVPLIFGSRNEVERLSRYYQEYVSGKEPDTFSSPLFSTRSLFRTQ